jgi:acyl carrier protein
MANVQFMKIDQQYVENINVKNSSKEQTMESLEKRIKEIISDKLSINVDKIVPQTNIVCIDSLDEIELLMAFEDEFDIEIPDEDAIKFKTVKDITSYIGSKV